MGFTRRAICSLVSLIFLAQTTAVNDAYAKGGHGGGSRGGGRGGERGLGRPGGHAGFANHYDNFGRWGGDRQNYAGSWGGWARPHHRWYQYGWGGWNEPYYAGGPGYGVANWNSQAVDEEGNSSTARSYTLPPIPVPAGGGEVVYQDAAAEVAAEIKTQEEPKKVEYKPVSTKALFRLGPDVDVLSNGSVAVYLNDAMFLLVRETDTLVVQQSNGLPVMALFTDPILKYNLASELKRQSLGLNAAMLAKMSATQSEKSEASKNGLNASKTGLEIENLESTIELLKKAKTSLGQVPDQPPDPTSILLDKNAVELFASVWLMKDGSYIVFRHPDGSIKYMNNSGIFAQPASAPLKIAYPSKFEQCIFDYLKKLIGQADSTLTDLKEHKDDTAWALEQLASIDIANENAGTAGNTTSDSQEAERRLTQAMSRSQRRLSVLSSEINLMPDEIEAAKKTLAMLEKS